MNIIFETTFGSHLYGTNTETSDRDVKGVYVASLEDIIHRRDKSTVCFNTKDSGAMHRNGPEDQDIEYKELRTFINDAMAGQTYALDMLFAPMPFWNQLRTSSLWLKIRENTGKLLSRNVAPYIGYCRQQAGKYGLKGSRLGELKRVISHLCALDPRNKLGKYPIEESEYVKVIHTSNTINGGEKILEQTFLEVLGKKFDMNRSVKEILPSLKKLDEMYGHRAVLAMNNEGIDWKAISHAFRLCYQLRELASTGSIEFPLKQAEELKSIKKGQLNYSGMQDKLYELMEEAICLIKKSSLPEEPDRDFWENFILNEYMK